ncbi:uncharacterized protein F4822DRAFT_199354 [Hypoxylon trugodes]|uniref:uncharacterized protein n=1 Tax=Hypoxylon trugodes TaxID=326681 RepID=UPI0021984B91|nr:uncharacterized protein F4822DRAFT_199354 [Hypoxylon trugodes]KAI1389406.1 hypothetical protein F4822DRAFT_199354 [Hypoxylon trugodes]
MDSSASVAQSFPKFMCLPLELRWKVWSYCLPHRVISIHYWRDERSPWMNKILRPNPHAPVISKVCWESYAYYMKHASRERVMGTKVSVWVNRKVDSLYINTETPLKRCRKETTGLKA